MTMQKACQFRVPRTKKDVAKRFRRLHIMYLACLNMGESRRYYAAMKEIAPEIYDELVYLVGIEPSLKK